jgi:uncharacterized membrane protein
MTSFLAGALGALTALLLLAAGAALSGFLHVRRRRRLGFGHRRGLRYLFRRLGTRPDQEDVLSREADALASELRAFRTEGRALRSDLAALLAAPTLDAGAVSAFLERPFARARVVRERLETFVVRVHETLDPVQRERLAALVTAGPHGHGRRHA